MDSEKMLERYLHVLEMAKRALTYSKRDLQDAVYVHGTTSAPLIGFIDSTITAIDQLRIIREKEK